MKKSEKIILIAAIIIGLIIIIQNCNRSNNSKEQRDFIDSIEKVEEIEKVAPKFEEPKEPQKKQIITERKNKVTYLETDAEDLSFVKSGGTKSVRISTDADNWDVVSSSSWLSISKNGNTLNVSCPSNRTGSNREQKIIIKAGDKSAVIFASQSATPTRFSLDRTDFVFEIGGGSFTVNVDTDVDNWYAISQTGGLSMEKVGDKLNVNIPQWNGYSRSWVISVNGEFNGAIRFTQAIKVRQKGYCSYCHGQGKITCGFCHGSRVQMNYSLDIPFQEPCSSCRGNGYYICSACNGTGMDRY